MGLRSHDYIRHHEQYGEYYFHDIVFYGLFYNRLSLHFPSIPIFYKFKRLSVTSRAEPKMMHAGPYKKIVFSKKFQIQNNLAPVLQCFVIDLNRFKQRSKRAKTVIQTAIETIGNGDKMKRTCTNEA